MRNDGPDDDRPLRARQPQVLEQPDKRHLGHGPQPHRLHPHAARAAQLQRVHVHRLHIGRRCRRGASRCRGRLPRQQQRGQPLRLTFDPLGANPSEQSTLAAKQLLQPRTQCRPVILVRRKMTAQVQQGRLADLAAHAHGLDQAVGMVGLAGGAVTGLGAADVHAHTLRQVTTSDFDPNEIIWHNIAPSDGRISINQIVR